MIEVPMSIEHAKQLYAKNEDIIWQDDITKEMYQILVAFKTLEEGESPHTRMEKVNWSSDVWCKFVLHKEVKIDQGWPPHSRSWKFNLQI